MVLKPHPHGLEVLDHNKWQKMQKEVTNHTEMQLEITNHTDMQLEATNYTEVQLKVTNHTEVQLKVTNHTEVQLKVLNHKLWLAVLEPSTTVENFRKLWSFTNSTKLKIVANFTL